MSLFSFPLRAPAEKKKKRNTTRTGKKKKKKKEKKKRSSYSYSSPSKSICIVRWLFIYCEIPVIPAVPYYTCSSHCRWS